jgi:hypothetical protein
VPLDDESLRLVVARVAAWLSEDQAVARGHVPGVVPPGADARPMDRRDRSQCTPCIRRRNHGVHANTTTPVPIPIHDSVQNNSA